MAYEQNGFFVCMLAHDTGLRGIAPGYAFTQRAEGQIEDWVTTVFGARDIAQTIFRPGQCFRRLWRPGIDGFDSVQEILAPSNSILNQAGVALSLLTEKFESLVRFIELDNRNLNAFSQMTREFLILCCTEIENSWRAVLITSDQTAANRRLSTNDYVRICDPYFLRTYRANLRHYESLPSVRPYRFWDEARPTASLPWYDAYNAAKHDRDNELSRATLERCIEALAAAAILYCAQFSIPSTGDWIHEPSFAVNRWLNIELEDPDPATFYVPPVQIPNDRIPTLWIYDGRRSANWEPEIRAI